MKPFFNKKTPDRTTLAAMAVTGAFLLYSVAANFMYPWRGDDFLCQHMLRTYSTIDMIIDSYFNWTLRLGNIICAFIEACRTKLVFNIINPIIQTALIWLIAGAAIGRFPDIRKKKDALLLMFTAGISVFVCRPADTVYWVPGATLYSWAAVIYLGLFIFISYREKQEPNSVWILTISCIWGLLAGYCNENAALTGLLLFGAKTFIKPSKLMFTTLAGYLGGAVLLFTTPGALKRVASMQNGDTALPVTEMFSKVPEILGFYAGSSLVPLCVLFELVIFYGRECKKETFLRAGSVFGLSLFSALVFAGAPLPPMRTYYLCSILVMVSCCVIFYETAADSKHANEVTASAVLCAVLILGLALPDFINIHNDEMLRNKLISEQKSANIEHITVPAHRTLRRSFLHYVFIEDITPDSEFWLNRNAALYYKVKSIKTLQTKQTPLFRERFMNFIKGKSK